jgi:hypothetical protein
MSTFWSTAPVTDTASVSEAIAAHQSGIRTLPARRRTLTFSIVHFLIPRTSIISGLMVEAITGSSVREAVAGSLSSTTRELR